MVAWALDAVPQSADDALREPRHPDIVGAAISRGITSVVHFTRTGGLKGIMNNRAVKARRDLPLDDRVKHVYEENAADRSRDLQWHGYINLSLSAINRQMFSYSKREHPSDEWVILRFEPEILGESGVVFSTTNNAYANAHRCMGLPGFDQMFAERVPWGYFGSVHDRRGRADNQTTDPQSEVLYPFELSLDHLHTISVGDEDTYETVAAILVHFPHPAQVQVDPEAFQ